MWKTILRWVLFLPGAILASLLASAVMRLLQRISMFFTGENPDGFLNKLWIELLANGLMGAAFVYVGSRIAPKHKKPVSYVLAVFIIMFAGMVCYPSIMNRDWWALFACIFMAGGAAIMAHSVATGDLDMDSHRLLS